MNLAVRQEHFEPNSKAPVEVPFNLLVEAYNEARNDFASQRGWPGCTPKKAGPETPRAAAKALRGAVDAVAAMPQFDEGGAYLGGTLEAKARIIGELMVDAAAYGEPWLNELATRLAERAAAVHRGELIPDPSLAVETVERQPEAVF